MGASLLAKACEHSTYMLTDTPLSRAGSLLHLELCWLTGRGRTSSDDHPGAGPAANGTCAHSL
ncbi:hypothetical protein FGA82_00575 [Pseudomonas fluorescens]|nr:hypothetical protein FGA82_00575 [Pseudomonas fluorescens]